MKLSVSAVTRSIFFLSIALICFSSGIVSKPADAAAPVKIGLVASLSGFAGFIGTPERDVIVAVVGDINKEGGIGGRQIELYVEDDQSSATNAVVAVTKLVRDKKVSIVLGPSMPDSGMAMIPVAEKESVPFICKTPVTSPFKKWVFLVGPAETVPAVHVLEYAVSGMGATRIALLNDTSVYGTNGGNAIKKAISRFPGVSLVSNERFDQADTSMIGQLNNIKAAKPDVVLLYSAGVPGSIVAKNANQLGLAVPFVTSNAVPTPEFMKLSGKIAEEKGWRFMAQKFIVAEKLPLEDPYRKNVYGPFRKLMQEKYGPSKELHNHFYPCAYDAIVAATEAIRLAGTDDRTAIRDALEKVKFDGLMGAFEYLADDHQSTKVDPAIPISIENGEYVPYNH